MSIGLKNYSLKNERENRINFDYSAGMPVDPVIVDEMIPYMTTKYGNPSSLHSFGQEARVALVDAQRRVAKLIGSTDPEREIYFTSSATESNNLALRGVALRNKKRGNHVIISAIEHVSIRNVAKYLQLRGFKITILPVGADGRVDVNFLKDAIEPGTILASIMHANNEIGTIQPIEEISSVTQNEGILLHVDATSSTGKIPIDVARSGIDLLTIPSNDLSGPKGVGGIFIKDGTPIEPIIFGGGQQRGLRSASEDVAAIVGMGKAAEIAERRMGSDGKRLTRMRDKIMDSVSETVEGVSVYGHREHRLPNNAMIGIFGVEGEQAIMELDKNGISASTGSACASKNLDLSHVLEAIGVNEVERYGTILFSLSRWNREKEVDRLLAVLPRIIGELREISPIWKFRDRLEEFYAG